MSGKMFQITCRCTAYNFPHRLGGGKCNGSDWCQSFYDNGVDRTTCDNCHLNVNHQCQVATGQESHQECPGIVECYHTLTDPELPIDFSRYFKKAFERQWDYSDY